MNRTTKETTDALVRAGFILPELPPTPKAGEWGTSDEKGNVTLVTEDYVRPEGFFQSLTSAAIKDTLPTYISDKLTTWSVNEMHFVRDGATGLVFQHERSAEAMAAFWFYFRGRTLVTSEFDN